jgi:hypothetical protein
LTWLLDSGGFEADVGISGSLAFASAFPFTFTFLNEPENRLAASAKFAQPPSTCVLHSYQQGLRTAQHHGTQAKKWTRLPSVAIC